MESLNIRAFEEIVENEGRPCLVIFSRETCNVCQEVHAMLDDIMLDYRESGFGFFYVDVEEEEALMNRYKIQGVPQVLFFDGGNLKKQLAGRHDEEVYISEIEKYVERT